MDCLDSANDFESQEPLELLAGTASQPSLSAAVSVLPAKIETTDIAGSTATTATLLVGESYQAGITAYTEHDWFRVQLQAGHTYTFASIGTGLNSLNQTYLVLRDFSGALLAADANSGAGTSSVIGMPAPLGSGVFTASYTGAYYIDVSSQRITGLGQYGVSVVESAASNNYKPGFDAAMGAGSIHTSTNSLGAPYDWNQLAGNIRGTGTTLTYSFRDSMTYASANGTFSKCTVAEMNAVSEILTMFSEVCGLNFNRVSPTGYSNNAQIVIANYSQPGSSAGAYAYLPSNSADSSGGDLWLNTAAVNPNAITKGAYSWFAIMHELGHALGLSHPGDYNAGSGSPTYSNAAQFIQDSEQYTIMSYWGGSNTGQSPGAFATAYTPLLLDIYELQTLYGANLSTRASNTVYGFNSTAGETYAFSASTAPYYCIWDGGGIDTLNASGYSQDQVINLNPGNFSNIGSGKSNISIAVGAQIENALGGTGNDLIIGNTLDNRIDGGSGQDTMSYAGSTSQYLVTPSNNGIIVQDTSSRDGLDTLLNIEMLRFADSSNSVRYQTGTSSVKDLVKFTGSIGQYVTSCTDQGAGVIDTISNRDNIQLLSNIERAAFTDSKLAFDIGAGQIAGEAYRMYQAAFNRTPDAKGLAGWINYLDGGADPLQMSQQFIASQEFQEKYQRLDNTGFVQLLYNNVLHRDGESSGVDGWVNGLNNGLSKAQVLLGFSESKENVSNVAPTISHGIQYTEWWLI